VHIKKDKATEKQVRDLETEDRKYIKERPRADECSTEEVDR